MASRRRAARSERGRPLDAPGLDTPRRDEITRLEDRLDELRDRMTRETTDDAALVRDLIRTLEHTLHLLRESTESLRRKEDLISRTKHLFALERLRYQELFNFSRDGYLVTDREGRIREANWASAELLKSDRESLRGQRITDFIRDGPTAELEGALDSMVSGGAASDEWHIEILPTDSTEPVSIVASLLVVRTSAARPPEFRWLLRRAGPESQEDQVRQEQELRAVAEQAERRATLLSEASQLLSDSLDPVESLQTFSDFVVRSFADCCVVYLVDDPGVRPAARSVATDTDHWVRTLQRRYDLSPNDPDGRIRKVIRTKEAEACGDENRSEELETDPPSTARLLLLPLMSRNSEKVTGVMMMAQREEREGFAMEDFVLAQELSRRAARDLENCLLHQQLKQAIIARDEVVGVVSHDLRNAVNVIVSYVEHLAAGASGESQVNDERFLRPIQSAVGQMKSLIGDLEQAPEGSVGRLALHRSRCDVVPIVREAGEVYEALAEDQGISLEVSQLDDLPPLHVDAHRLLQVFANLIGNAIKFTEGGGSVRLGAGREGTEIHFFVSDTGAGIPEEERGRVFDWGWGSRTRETVRASESEGEGLGLSIARTIVEAHGGRIWVESEPGEGSTFHFTIPLPDSGNGGSSRRES